MQNLGIEISDLKLPLHFVSSPKNFSCATSTTIRCRQPQQPQMRERSGAYIQESVKLRKDIQRVYPECTASEVVVV
jgi:hypothetical protein